MKPEIEKKEQNKNTSKVKKQWYYIGSVVIVSILATLLFLFNSGTNPEEEIIQYNPAFDTYISSYTSGELSRNSKIKIRFQEQMVDFSAINQKLDHSIFDFTPSIKGTTKWIDTRTVEFTPNQPLPSETVYIGELALKDVFNENITVSEDFQFQFHTKAQGFSIQFESVKSQDENNLVAQLLHGELSTLDFEKNELIEKFLTAKQNDKELQIEWMHSGSNALSHAFTISGIKRTEKESFVEVVYDPEIIHVKEETSTRKFPVKALGDFTLTNSYVRAGDDQYINLEFSDQLDPNQELKGLITVKNTKITTNISGNQIRIYPQRSFYGKLSVTINAGLLNKAGYKSDYSSTLTLYISQEKPEVRLLGKGNIIPKTNGKIPFVFEVKNLDAVDIRVIKVFEKNIPQFFQVNELDGNSELKRVGQEIARHKVSLAGQNKNLGQWNQHTVDLNKIISPEPGAIYEIAIGFKKEYSLYSCEADEEEASSTEKVQDMLQLQHWDNPNRNYWGYYYGSYRDRDNPCKEAYYNKNRVVTRNILASSLGIIVKSDLENNYTIVVNDINTTAPLPNTKVYVYDYQQQLISSGTTDSKGILQVKLKRKPFLLIAKKEKERGYLRLDDGSAMNFSRFDVSGKTYSKGLKGFIYGERGVWRPGDTLFLTFVLEDRQLSIPQNHPVTFELFDPSDKLVNKLVTKENVNGFYNYIVNTKASAPTGTYRVKAHIGGATFYKSVKIETIVPNRLKIKFDMNGEEIISNDSEPAQLTATWLHGAKAGNLKTDVKVTLKQMVTAFDNYGDFNFDNPLMRFWSEEETVFDGKLDPEGKTSIPLRFDMDNDAPGRLKVHFKTKVFEPGGGFSVDRFSIPFDPYDEYVGIQTPKGDNRGILVTDKDHEIQLVVLDKDGKKLKNKTVEVEVYRLRWHWWWDYYSNNDDFDFRSRNNYSSLKKATVTTDANGIAKWKINISENNWGRFFVNATLSSGHSTGKIIYVDWPSWSSRTRKNTNAEGATMLLISSDEKEYKTDDMVTIAFPSSLGGKALVSIETGSKIIETHWVETQKGETRFTFKANKSMAPNIYVYVALLQPHEKTKNDLPLRMYGILPLKIVDPSTVLHPVLTMPKEFAPESTVHIKVSEQNNQAMTYTLAIVDEGLLDLTRFKTPDVWSHFHQKQALNIKTWDLYNQVIAARKGQMKNLLSIGGGDNGEGEKGKNQNRFKPMVRFIGPFHLNDGQTKIHKIEIPNYIGSVRTMVIAGYDGAYGNTEETTPVRKPLMVLPALPRVIGPGETIKIPVTVFAMDDKIKNVKVSIQSNEFFELQDDATKELMFTEMGDQMVFFKVKVAEAVGKGFVKINISSGNEKAHYETYIDVRNPNPILKEFYQTTLNDETTTWDQSVQSFGIDGTNELSIEVSALYPINLDHRLNYLIRYPYGCVEQTTSSVFPQLHLDKFIRLNSSKSKEIEKNIKSGIQRLTEFQTYSGGLSYWPGGQWENAWGTNYAGHFMLEAENAGYHIPSAFKLNWINYQTRMAENFGSSSKDWQQTTQAYRLYLLAMAKKPSLGAMNRLKQQHNLSNMAGWYLAGAYHLAGHYQIASEIASSLSIPQNEYRNWRYTYGSIARDKAVILSICALLNKKQTAEDLVEDLCYKLSESKRYMSTQTTAYSLVSIAHYLKMNNSSTLNFKYRIDKGEWKTVTDDKTIWSKTIAVDQGAHDVEIENLTSNKLHPHLTMEGQPMPSQYSNEADESKRLTMVVKYSQNGRAVSPTSIQQGTDVKIEVTIHNPSNQDYSELALTHIFPSGWEVHNQRMDNSVNTTYDRPEYLDLRDDRVNLFFDLKNNKSKTFSYTISGSYAGDFYLPTIKCQAMYDHTIYASKAGQWVKVVR